jgi:hypothetical protein
MQFQVRPELERVVIMGSGVAEAEEVVVMVARDEMQPDVLNELL